MARIYLSPPEMSGREREMLLAALDGGWLAPTGPDLAAFEAELAAIGGTAHAVATNVAGVVTTSSPGPTPTPSSARCSALVPLLRATQWAAPQYAAKSRSNAST